MSISKYLLCKTCEIQFNAWTLHSIDLALGFPDRMTGLKMANTARNTATYRGSVLFIFLPVRSLGNSFRD